jgi:GDPmannose 4,6-dehydratase
MVATYRERYGLHASSGIAFNHESPRRPAEFVTGKVARAAAAIKLGFETSVTLGDLSAQRDWGAAKDYVDAMWRMLQQPEADDFVIATGRAHSVQDLVNAAFAHVGLRADDHVIVDPELVRPPDPTPLVGDPSKARHALGWKAETSFADLVGSMVESYLRRLPAASDSDRTANVP